VPGVCGAGQRRCGDRGDVALVDRRARGVAVGAPHDASLTDLRRPGQGVGVEVGAPQEGPVQATLCDGVLGRLEGFGEASLPGGVLHGHCRQQDNPVRAVLARKRQEFGGAVADGARAEQDRLNITQR
jgi:hypothetical protein